jgi:uncharacterized protein involved in exopolysaccharide biosynthesis
VATLSRLPEVETSPNETSSRFSHFGRVLWRRRGLVFAVAVAAAGGAAWAIVGRGALEPEVETAVVFGLETPSQWGAAAEFADLGAYRLELVRSDDVLRRVVTELSLQYVADDHPRTELFDSLSVDSLAQPGSYEVSAFRDSLHGSAQYAVRYTNADRGYVNRQVAIGLIVPGAEVRLPGIAFRFSAAFAAEPHGFQFRILSTEQAVSHLRAQMMLEFPTRREPDRFTVTLKGRDARLLTQTLNTVAAAFVQVNSEVRQQRTRERLEVLEQQLAKAQRHMQESNEALQRFLAANPSASLENRVASAISGLAMLQDSARRSEADVAEARRLQTMLEENGSVQNMSEALAFLERQDPVRATSIREELLRLRNKASDLDNVYMPGHPLIAENERSLAALATRTAAVLGEVASKLTRARSAREQRIAQLSNNLKGLPERDLQLAELKQTQEINASIYSNLRTRYNEAKISDAVQMADVFLISGASPPAVLPLWMRIARVAAFAALGSAVAVLGLLLLLNLTDRTASSGFELQRMTAMPVLESIPTIPLARRRRERRKAAVSTAAAIVVLLLGALAVIAVSQLHQMDDLERAVLSTLEGVS